MKYWDADKFEALLTLDGHHAAVWCLAISGQGDFVVTAGADRSLRRWARRPRVCLRGRGAAGEQPQGMGREGISPRAGAD